MKNFVYFFCKKLFLGVVVMCLTVLYASCGSRSASSQNVEGFEDQIALADSILLYFQQEQFDKIVVHFDDNMKQHLNKEQLAVVWTQLNTQFGKFAKSEFHSAQKIDAVGDRIVFQCNFGSTRLYFDLIFGKDDKIAGMFFKPNV